MTSKPSKRFLQALAGETLTPPPFWLMRQAGRYLPEYRATRAEAGSFLDLCYNPELAVEVTLQPLRRYGFDAAILFSDILVIPDALRQRVAFKEGEGPVLTPIRSAMDLDALDISGLHDHLAPVYATVKGLSGAIPQETALIGFSGTFAHGAGHAAQIQRLGGDGPRAAWILSATTLAAMVTLPAWLGSL